MTNQLIPYKEVEQFGSAMVASGYFSDANKVSQAIVKIQAGAELGLPPFASMTGIHIIKGKPVLGANVLATLIKNDPRYDYRVKKMDDSEVIIHFYESGEMVGESSFTIQDANKAQTQNIGKFPRNMLFARAMSNGAKWFVPGIFGGMPVYTPEDFNLSLDDDGDVVEGQVVNEPSPAPQPAKAAQAQATHTAVDLSDQPEAQTDLDTLRNDLAQYTKMTYVQVADKATETGLYNSRDHAHSAMKENATFMKSGGKLSAGIVREVGLDVFDWLIARKAEAAPVEYDDLFGEVPGAGDVEH